jgi:hypothetical protein
VNFAEQPPSDRWAALKYRGVAFAEVWFKPEGDPFALTFRIPQQSFHIPGLGEQITIGNLLAAVAILPEEVEYWGHDREDDFNPELGQPLTPPPQDVDHLHVFVNLKPPSQDVASDESNDAVILLEKFQDLEGRWNAILSAEAAIDQLRARVEGAAAEMDAASQRMLASDEKVHALNADVHVWNKAKTRARYALPKAKEFIHRATWAIGTPERKQLGELFKAGLRRDIPLPELDRLPEELARLLKQHQVLSAQGGTVCQECKNITAEIQGTLRTLLSNAAANAQKKRVAAHKKGKYV